MLKTYAALKQLDQDKGGGLVAPGSQRAEPVVPQQQQQRQYSQLQMDQMRSQQPQM